MTDLVSVLGLHGVPQLFMLSNEDVDRYKGHKAVIAIMAVDRGHPEFKKATEYFQDLAKKDDVVFVTEDHADGPLHERFHCQAYNFYFALVDKAGHTVLHGERIPTLQDVRVQLQGQLS